MPRRNLDLDSLEYAVPDSDVRIMRFHDVPHDWEVKVVDTKLAMLTWMPKARTPEARPGEIIPAAMVVEARPPRNWVPDVWDQLAEVASKVEEELTPKVGDFVMLDWKRVPDTYVPEPEASFWEGQIVRIYEDRNGPHADVQRRRPAPPASASARGVKPDHPAALTGFVWHDRLEYMVKIDPH